MFGKYNGVQVIIKRDVFEVFYMYVYCKVYCLNLGVVYVCKELIVCMMMVVV